MHISTDNLFSVAAASLLAVFGVAHAQPPSPNPVAWRQLEQQFQDMVKTQERAGIAWIVAQHGRQLSSGAIGWQDQERRIPVDELTTFRLYSMTRAITTVAALRLMDKGKLNLDQPLAHYLPKFAAPKVVTKSLKTDEIQLVPAKREITVRDLMTYQAGFGYAYDYPTSLGLKREEILGLNLSTAQGIDRLAEFPLLHHPGERWHYGFASDVLGRVIELITAQPLDQALQQLVFDPLGMTSTGFFSSLDHLAKAYGPDPLTGRWIELTERLPKSADYIQAGSMHSGGGGLLSSASDYFVFCEMLRNRGVGPHGVFLKASTVDLMERNTMSPEQGPLFWHRADASPVMTEGGWGLGIGVRQSSVNTPLLTSRQGELFWGGLAGTGFFIDREAGITAVVMTQYLGPDGDKPVLLLRQALYGSPRAEETNLAP
ncbi:MAG: class A beta-lactamase-related serine hydrolase [Gammaproteobacteria bacterium]|jgi:CubicO group peptidase (beta-lactamase class C family)|nr:class A beta-lactamase-related serine hydrolase [Gammaproteobacteria bacterium]